QRPDVGVHQFLHDVRVCLDVRGAHVQRRGRVLAAQGGLRAGGGAGVVDDVGAAGGQQLRHGRLGGHAAVDVLVLHGRDERGAGLDADAVRPGRVHTVLLRQELGEEVGRGAHVGDAQVAAVPV